MLVTRSRNWYQKLVSVVWYQKLARKILTQVHHSFLHGLCHVPHSFCDRIELCSIPCKKLVPEKNGYQTDRHMCKFLVPDNWYVSGASVAGIMISLIT